MTRKYEEISELTPRRGITKDGEAVLYHRIKNQNIWVVKADPSGEILFRGNSQQAIEQWMYRPATSDGSNTEGADDAR